MHRVCNLLLPNASELGRHLVFADKYLVSLVCHFDAPSIKLVVVEMSAVTVLLRVLIGNVAIHDAVVGYLQLVVAASVKLHPPHIEECLS